MVDLQTQRCSSLAKFRDTEHFHEDYSLRIGCWTRLWCLFGPTIKRCVLSSSYLPQANLLQQRCISFAVQTLPIGSPPSAQNFEGLVLSELAPTLLERLRGKTWMLGCLKKRRVCQSGFPIPNFRAVTMNSVIKLRIYSAAR
jgi:hypothetical protein